MEAYLDNAATTKLDGAVKKLLINSFDTMFANPSSLHSLGVKVEKEIKNIKKSILKELSDTSGEIIFTSGGTEANNLAISSILKLYSKRSKHIITTEFEHKSVLNVIKHYEENGFDVTYLKPNSDGIITFESVKNAIRKDTVLISIMYVNNEIGTIQEIEKIGRYISNLEHKPIFHVDAIQAFMKFKINVKHIDLLTFSAHKINALKGVGGIYKKKKIRLSPLFFGGQQENKIRPGTENVLGILSIKESVLDFSNNRKVYYESVKELKEKFINNIMSNLEDVYVNGDLNKASPYILNISFKGVKAEVLLHYLEMSNIYISTGSACNSKTKMYSYVLNSMGLDDSLKESAVRISFSKLTTLEEIEYASKIIIEKVTELRKVMRGR